MSMMDIQRISHSLCRTLEQLHQAGVVVQDIKPQNVLLDSYGAPVFADFGISRVIGRTTKIMPTSIVGTFNYMAPEAFVPPLGIEADIWSMGCLIVEMCTGAAPWADMQMQQIMAAVYMMKRVPDVPGTMPAADTVRCCFAFEPSERPTALELANALSPEMASLPEIVGGMAHSQELQRVTREKEGLQREVQELKNTNEMLMEVARKAQVEAKEVQHRLDAAIAEQVLQNELCTEVHADLQGKLNAATTENDKTEAKVMELQDKLAVAAVEHEQQQTDF